MTLDSLHARRPSATKLVVCRAPLKAPLGTKFFAYQSSTGRIWWDADRASFERFVEMYADLIYEVHPFASVHSVRELPPPHGRGAAVPRASARKQASEENSERRGHGRAMNVRVTSRWNELKPSSLRNSIRVYRTEASCAE